ncbi:MAG: chemotaxis protein CheW [SAR324 cluster bacterium]|uniref:Chemotaxis protein CheW n=1 Tax=SAR324 cluster bacterium TaxID=2024889 RepID=A0A2A4T254_9DELT|nr:MAG: chemotaxis protein CheW [SAR324 cluster bacterium]
MAENGIEESSLADSSMEVEEIGAQEGKFLTFPLADSLYGIEISQVLEVVIHSDKTRITKVPHMPLYTKGVINLRGKIIPIIDLRSRFLLSEGESSDRTCFVVVNIHGVITGLVVDTVSGVVTIAQRDIDPAPKLDISIQNQFIAGMGKTQEAVYILLNIDELLEQGEIEELEGSVNS